MDNYTKGVLTVIAICLVSITFQLSGTQIADNKVHKIAICDKGGYNCADMLMTGGSGDANLLGIYSNR